MENLFGALTSLGAGAVGPALIDHTKEQVSNFRKAGGPEAIMKIKGALSGNLPAMLASDMIYPDSAGDGTLDAARLRGDI